MALSTLQELPATIRGLADQVGPAVVGVNARGCGVVVGKDLVVTNAHNLGGLEAEIVFAGGRVATAQLAGADLDGDVAVIQVDTGDVTPLRVATVPAALGDVVFGLSRPGGRVLRVTAGTISSTDRAFRGPRGRRISGGLEHTAPLPRGSSGGPIVDADGQLVGLNTHRVEDGFYLALPSDAEFMRFVELAAKGEVPERRTLGVAVVPPMAARRLRAAVGLSPIDAPLIRAVDDNGPAARAGLLRGDVIVRVGESAITTVDDLHRALSGVGKTVEVEIVRGSDELSILVDFDNSSASQGDV